MPKNFYKVLVKETVLLKVKDPEGLLPLGRSALHVRLVVAAQATVGLGADGLVVPPAGEPALLNIVSMPIEERYPLGL